MEVFRDAYTPEAVSEYPEMQLLNKDIKERWRKVVEIRSETGFTTEASPGGEAAGGYTPRSEGRSLSPHRRGTHLKVKPPKFLGVLSAFQDFKELFMSVVDGEDLSEAAKKAIMIESMVGPGTIANAISACKGSPTLVGAMAIFSLKYEDRKEVVANHLGKILNVSMTGQTKDELENLVRVTRDSICGLKLAESYTAEQITLACVVNRMKPQLKKEWLQRMSIWQIHQTWKRLMRS